jgi:hypothetical protein
MLWHVLNEVYPGSISAMDRGTGINQIHILGPEKIFPLNWIDISSGKRLACALQLPARFRDAYPYGTFDRAACAKGFPEAYAISYWTHSWE